MVKMSFPIFPNCRITLSCCSAETLWDGSTAATSWKFLTEATVTRPLKLRHQHCSCSCHLGDLFFKTSGSAPGLDARGDCKKGVEGVELKSAARSLFFKLGEGENCSSQTCGKIVGVGAVPPS